MALTVRERNDAIRKKLPIIYRPHRIIKSAEVEALEISEQRALIDAIRDYDFSETDALSDHDIGVVELFGDRWSWRFDYYDRNLEHYRRDGVRVLVIAKAKR